MSEVVETTAEAPVVPFKSHLDEELYKARGELREIDENLRNLTGRNVMELTSRGGRFGGPPRGGGMGMQNRLGPNNNSRFFQAPVQEEEVDDVRTAAVKRKFTAVGDELDDDWDRDKQPKQGRFVSVAVNRSYRDGGNSDSISVRRPSVPSAVIPAQRELKSRDAAITEIKEGEKKEVKQRNRRMFGVLMGTLQRFKSDEDKHYKDQEKKQKEIEQKLEETKKKEAEQIEKDKYALLQKRRQQQQEIRRIQRKKAMIESGAEWEAHQRLLQNFIQTQTKPAIFYLPLKHTMRTIELQKKSSKKIEELIAQHKEQLQSDLELLEKPTGMMDVTVTTNNSSTKPVATENESRRRHRSHSDESDEESDGEKMTAEVVKNGSVSPAAVKTGESDAANDEANAAPHSETEEMANTSEDWGKTGGVEVSAAGNEPEGIEFSEEKVTGGGVDAAEAKFEVGDEGK